MTQPHEPDFDGAQAAPQETRDPGSAADMDDDFWGDRGRSEAADPAGDTAGAGEAGSFADHAGARVSEEALDVDATDVPRKKSKVVPFVIAAIFLAALGTVGSALWSAYQKFVPQKEQREQRGGTTAGGGVIDLDAKTSTPARNESGLPAPGNSTGGAVLFQPTPAASAPSAAEQHT